jgi:hypothetical protein
MCEGRTIDELADEVAEKEAEMAAGDPLLEKRDRRRVA